MKTDIGGGYDIFFVTQAVEERGKKMILVSSGMAIFLTLFAAAMWGSWFQSLNHIKGYPISGFVLWLYTSSLVLVWGVVLVLMPSALPEGIGYYIAGKMGTVVLVAVCGAAMAIGLHIQIKIMGQIGMILSTAISGAFGSIFGVIITVIVGGGLPPNVSLGLVILSTTILIGASYICQYAAVLRDKDNNISEGGKQASAKIVLLLIFSNLLVSGYPYGLAAGTITEANPGGIPPLLCVAFLATGSFIGVAITTSVDITRNKEWQKVLHPGSKKPFVLGIVSGLCHYGGNILSIISAPVLSPAISFLFGRTANMWTYFWGVAYGEFSGAKKRTITVLVLGILAYVLGIVLLAVGMYR